MQDIIASLKSKIKKSPRVYSFLLSAINLKTYLFSREAWGFWAGSVIFPIRGLLNVYGLPFMRKPYDKIEVVKNKHKGERCFIVSTGPSLTVEDVNLIRNEKSISMNTIFRIYDETDWRPTYYTSEMWGTEMVIRENNLTSFEGFAEEYCFFARQSRKLVGDSEKYIFLNVCWLDHFANYGSTKFKYTPNLLYGMYDFYSATHGAIILAIYMGFDEIYLLGTDNTYTEAKQYFNDGGKKDFKQANADQKMKKARDSGYKELLRISQRQGVKIYNCTRGGKLDVFPRRNLEDVIGNR